MHINHTLPRFSWVLDHAQTGPDPACDVDLLGDDDFALVPSKGSLVPGWLLLIPRVRTLSLSQLLPEQQQKLLALCDVLRKALAPLGTFYLFEHGAAETGSSIGCGVDQAHLHLVPLAFDLVTTALAARPQAEWQRADVHRPWEGAPFGRDYYLVSDFRDCWITKFAPAESQFFRRLIASSLSKSELWNYRDHPHDEISLCTARQVRNLLAAD